MTTADDSVARGPTPRVEVIAFALLLAVLNLPLVCGNPSARLAFEGAAVAAGEWWRLLTFPFIHVSWYHLLLDGSAFLTLYANLPPGPRWRRLAMVAASAVGSVVAALWLSPLVQSHGLCGLSGVAHGLMVVGALDLAMMPNADPRMRAGGALVVLAITGKCLLELWTGHALFEAWHFGLIGTPIVASHLGGVLGALFADRLWRIRNFSVGVRLES